MNVENLIDSFSEFKDVKNIDRETMMSILEDVLKRCPVWSFDGSSTGQAPTDESDLYLPLLLLQ